MESVNKPSFRSRLTAHTRRVFLAGLILLVPVALTYLVLRFVFNTVDGILQPAIEELLARFDFDTHIPGLGILLFVVIIYTLGLLGTNVLGRRSIQLVQAIFQKVPLFRIIYTPAKLLLESFSGSGTSGFKRAVLVEYPRPAMWAVGFLTAITTDEEGQQLALVYIPTAPTPQSGWVALVPVQDVYDCDLTVQQALNSVLSGGILTPALIKKKPLVL